MYLKAVVCACVVVLPLVGCATIERDRAKDKEHLLAAAGFHAKPADSPEKLGSLGSLPPHKLVSQKKDDQFVYVYADPDYCRCMWIGGPSEYSAYQRIIAERENAEMIADASMNWDLWGGPWLY